MWLGSEQITFSNTVTFFFFPFQLSECIKECSTFKTNLEHTTYRQIESPFPWFSARGAAQSSLFFLHLNYLKMLKKGPNCAGKCLLIFFSLCVLVQDSFSRFKIQGACWKRSAIGSLSHSRGAKWISALKSICFGSLLTGRKIGTVAFSSLFSQPLHPCTLSSVGAGE